MTDIKFALFSVAERVGVKGGTAVAKMAPDCGRIATRLPPNAESGAITTPTRLREVPHPIAKKAPPNHR